MEYVFRFLFVDIILLHIFLSMSCSFCDFIFYKFLLNFIEFH